MKSESRQRLRGLVSSWIVGLALFGAACSVAVVWWTVVHDRRPLPAWIWIPLFVGCFPVAGAGFIAGRWWRENSSASDGPHLRRPYLVLRSGVALLVLGVVGLLTFTAVRPADQLPPGQPGIVDGRYVVNNHGKLTTITRDQYLRAQTGGQGGFEIAAYFLYSSALLSVAIPAVRTTTRKPGPIDQ